MKMNKRLIQNEIMRLVFSLFLFFYFNVMVERTCNRGSEFTCCISFKMSKTSRKRRDVIRFMISVTFLEICEIKKFSIKPTPKKRTH